MTKIIFNADDFGLSRGTNYGIVDAFKHGVLTSTTLMVTMPGFEHALELMDCYPDLGVGLHLNIALGVPLTSGESLINSSGQMMKPQTLKNHQYKVEEVIAEFEAQYQKFTLKTGRKPSHLDSHLFTTDKVSSVRKAAQFLAMKYNIPLRNCDVAGFKHVEFITFRSFDEAMGLAYLYEYLPSLSKYEYVEIMTHPGYLDHFIFQNSSYTNLRTEEVEILCSDKLRNLLENLNFELITYDTVKNDSK